LAMVDACWLVMHDEKLYKGGEGANEISVVGWGRDFNPVPMRLALTRQATSQDTTLFAPGIVSLVDTEHDLKGVQLKTQGGLQLQVERLITEDPTITKDALVKQTGGTMWDVRKALKALGCRRRPGGKKGSTEWSKSNPQDAEPDSD